MDQSQTDSSPIPAASLECEEARMIRAKMMPVVPGHQWSCVTVTRDIRDFSAINVHQDILEIQWSPSAAAILASAMETSTLLIQMRATRGQDNASNVCTIEEEMTVANALMDIMNNQTLMVQTLLAFLADATSVEEILLSETRATKRPASALASRRLKVELAVLAETISSTLPMLSTMEAAKRVAAIPRIQKTFPANNLAIWSPGNADASLDLAAETVNHASRGTTATLKSESAKLVTAIQAVFTIPLLAMPGLVSASANLESVDSTVTDVSEASME